MQNKLKVIVITGNLKILGVLRRFFKDTCDISIVCSRQDALVLAEHSVYDLAFIDSAPFDNSLPDLPEILRDTNPNMLVVFLDVFEAKNELKNSKREAIAFTKGNFDIQEKNTEFLSIKDVAILLKVSKVTVYKLVNKGIISSSRIGGQFRINKKSIDRYLSFS